MSFPHELLYGKLTIENVNSIFYKNKKKDKIKLV